MIVGQIVDIPLTEVARSVGHPNAANGCNSSNP